MMSSMSRFGHWATWLSWSRILPRPSSIAPSASRFISKARCFTPANSPLRAGTPCTSSSTKHVGTAIRVRLSEAVLTSIRQSTPASFGIDTCLATYCKSVCRAQSTLKLNILSQILYHDPLPMIAVIELSSLKLLFSFFYEPNQEIPNRVAIDKFEM